MKLYICAVFLVASASAATFNPDLLKFVHVPEEPKTTVSLSGRSLAKGFKYCTPENNLQTRCSSNCENIEYCLNGRTMSVNCKSQTGKKYCDMETNECSDTIEVCYGNPDFCPKNGRYPDLTNCQRYVYCDGIRMYPYECPANTMWDYKDGTCKQEAICRTYTSRTECSGENYNLMIQHLNPKWFVFCNYGRPLLGECPGTTYTFDEDSGSCRYQCGVPNYSMSNGKYPDEFSNTIYYECTKVGKKWNTYKRKCPTDTQFDRWQQVCKSGRTVSTFAAKEVSEGKNSTEVAKPEPLPA